MRRFNAVPERKFSKNFSKNNKKLLTKHYYENIMKTTNEHLFIC